MLGDNNNVNDAALTAVQVLNVDNNNPNARGIALTFALLANMKHHGVGLTIRNKRELIRVRTKEGERAPLPWEVSVAPFVADYWQRMDEVKAIREGRGQWRDAKPGEEVKAGIPQTQDALTAT